VFTATGNGALTQVKRSGWFASRRSTMRAVRSPTRRASVFAPCANCRT